MTKIRIVAAILDTVQLVLYKDDGKTIEIRQGDSRVQRIIDEVTEPLSTQGWAEVNLDREDPEANVYRDFEKLVKGAISFFRVHKDDLSQLFEKLVETTADNGPYGKDTHLAPVSLGTVPGSKPEQVDATSTEVSTEAPTVDQIADATENQKPTIREATDQIMSQAQSVADPGFTTLETKPDQTMIAAVKDNETGAITIVPGMENLQPQFAAAIKLGSPEGVKRFLERLAAVINDRKHTIDELLNFMSKGDLPIADDGSILAYKVLTTGHGEKKGYFVDCHSKSVQQRVGSFVRQLKVDENRRTECSTGLHIARRGYLRGFSGNIIVLVKIAPEDVIAVPLGEPNKMRARGYHIVSEVPASEHGTLRNNRPLEGTEAKKLLAMAIAGNHIDVIEEVIIGGPKGTEVVAVAKPVEEVKVAKPPKPRKKTTEAEPIETDKAAAPPAPPVDVKTTSDNAVTAKTESRTDKAARLLAVMNKKANGHNDRRQAAIDLAGLKKSSKIGWDKLGLDAKDVEEVQRLAASEPKSEDPKASEKPGKMPKTDRTKQEKMVSAIAPIVEAVSEADEPVKRTKPIAAKKPAAGTKQKKLIAHPDMPTTPLMESRNDKARRLFKAKDWSALYDHKKSAKVGWEKLGFSGQEIERIVKSDPKK